MRIRDGVAVTKIIHKTMELTADWIRLRNEELVTLYCLTGMFRCEGHVACMEEARNIYIAIYEWGKNRKA